MLKLFRSLVLGCVVAFALVGCGGGKPSDKTIHDLAGSAVIKDAVTSVQFMLWMSAPEDFFGIDKIDIQNVIKRSDNQYEVAVVAQLKHNYALTDVPPNAQRGFARVFGEFKKGDRVQKDVPMKVTLVKGDRSWMLD